MRTPFLFLLRFLLGASLAWFLGHFLIGVTGNAWHRLGGHDPVSTLHTFRHVSGPIDIVFFGTSTTRNAVVPEVLEQELQGLLQRPISVWNLALPNATPEIGRILTEEFFTSGRPHCLVLEAAPFLWDGDRGDDADFSVYWRWFSSPLAWRSNGRPLRRQDFLPFLRNLDRDWEDLWTSCSIMCLGKIRPDTTGLPSQGGIYHLDDLELPLRGERVDKTTPIREARRVSRFSTPEIWQQELERILATCKKLDIDVILMHQPFYEKLMPMFEPGNYEAFLVWIRGVAREHELPLLLLQDEIAMDVLDFRDYIHYSPQGARHFTQELAPLLAPLLRRDEAPTTGD